MPIVSKAQNRWARANEAAAGKTGKAAREFIKATPAGAIKNLPERKTPKPKGK